MKATEALKLIEGQSETASLEFKGHMDVNADRDWAEIVKDIVALANSGGGLLVFGLDDNGQPTGIDHRCIVEYDVSRVTAKVKKYTGVDLCDIVLCEKSRDGRNLAVLAVGGVDVPVVFSKDGQYCVNGEPKFAFRAGQAVFRHGAKSEPGTTDDLRGAIERRLSDIRDEWLGNIKQVVAAPPGAKIQIVQANPIGIDPAKHNVRLVEDGSAQPGILVHTDKTHPYRQSEVLQKINSKLMGRIKVTSGMLQDVRKVHRVDSKAAFYFKGSIPGYPHQFSDAYIDWIADNFERDPYFFSKAREARRSLVVTRSDTRGTDKPLIALAK